MRHVSKVDSLARVFRNVSNKYRVILEAFFSDLKITKIGPDPMDIGKRWSTQTSPNGLHWRCLHYVTSFRDERSKKRIGQTHSNLTRLETRCCAANSPPPPPPPATAHYCTQKVRSPVQSCSVGWKTIEAWHKGNKRVAINGMFSWFWSYGSCAVCWVLWTLSSLTVSPPRVELNWCEVLTDS